MLRKHFTKSSLIVVGDSDGHVKFIDQNLHILIIFKHYNLGPVSALSFSDVTKDYES